MYCLTYTCLASSESPSFPCWCCCQSICCYAVLLLTFPSSNKYELQTLGTADSTETVVIAVTNNNREDSSRKRDHFPPWKRDFQHTPKEPCAGFKSLSDVCCRISPSLRPCFPRFISFIPLFLCCFLRLPWVSPWGDTQNHKRSLATSPWKHLLVWEGAEALHGTPQLYWIGHLATAPGTFHWHQQPLNTMFNTCKTLSDVKSLQKLWQDREEIESEGFCHLWRAASAAALCVIVVPLCGVIQQLQSPGSVSWSHRGHLAPSLSSLSCRGPGTAIPCSAACPWRALVLWVRWCCWHLLAAHLQGFEEPRHTGNSQLAVPPCSHLCHTTGAPWGAWLMEVLPVGHLHSPGCAGSMQTGMGCLCQQHCSTCAVGTGIHRRISGPFFLWLPLAVFVKEWIFLVGSSEKGDKRL